MAGKTDIIADVAKALNITNKSAVMAVEGVLDAITERLASHEDVTFRGFGSFKVKHRPARTGRNPQTNQPIEIPAKDVVTFKAAK